MENALWRDRNKLFVAGIPPTVDDKGLSEKFAPFGEMFQSKVVLDKNTGRSRGFGFITFSQYESCLDAIAKLDKSKWEKRILNVRFLTPKNEGAANPAPAPHVIKAPTKISYVRPRPEGCTSIFVGNMPYEITETILRKFFAPCGEIRAIRFCEDIKTKEFRGFGYVQFFEGEACEKAFQYNERIVMGRPLRVDYDDDSRNTANNNNTTTGDNSGGAFNSTMSHEEFKKKLKKGICHKFQQGLCERGNDCKFAHVKEKVEGEEEEGAAAPEAPETPAVEAPYIINGVDEDAPLCMNYQKGKCKRGNGCRFRHMSDINAAAALEEEPSTAFTAAAPVVAKAVCLKFQEGYCDKGSSCRLAHVYSNNSEESPTSTATSAPAASATSASLVSTNHSEYQNRFQNICYNWQKSQSCVRGDTCPFMHEPPSSSTSISTKAVTEISTAAAAASSPPPSKKRKKEKKEKKAKKEKKRKKNKD